MTDNQSVPKKDVRNLLLMTDEMIKREQYSTAADYVKKALRIDPDNAYAKAYEERLNILLAERSAKRNTASLLPKSMRSMISDQEKAPLTPAKDLKDSIDRQPMLSEFSESLQEARDRLYDLIIVRTASPQETAAKAREMVDELTHLLQQRFDKIRTSIELSEQDFIKTIDEQHRQRSRKMYRSLVYMMHKLGVRFEHRSQLLYLVSYYANFSSDEEKELQHNAEIGIYEDLLKNISVQNQESEEQNSMLNQVRVAFGITDDEHETLMRKIKQDLLFSDSTPTMSVVDADDKLRTIIMETVRSEFPRIAFSSFRSPAEFFDSIGDQLPNIIITGTIFDGGGFQGIEFLKELKQKQSFKDLNTDLILMVPSNDPFFDEVVQEIGIQKILHKPFSKELLMWTLRPYLPKASGATIINTQ